ncbi:MAG: AAA family ATPase [Phycisphaerae bacterium]|nr:AAA family ATPase [Phycisphaerae bacterium]
MHEALARELDGTHPLVLIRTDDEDSIRDAIFTAIGGERALRSWTAVRGLCDGRLGERSQHGTERAAGALAWLATQAPSNAAVNVFYDLGAHLDDAPTIRALREAVDAARRTFGVVVLVERDGRMPPSVECDAFAWTPPPPLHDDLERIVRDAVREVKKTRRVRTEITRSQLDSILRSLVGLSTRQAARVVQRCISDDDRLDSRDIERLAVLKRNALGDLGGVLEFVLAPVSLDGIGGMASLKKWLDARRTALSKDAVAFGLRPPRGVLMLGVPGAGKSLAAKAIATAWNLPLLRLDAGALFDKFIGESERKLRDSLVQAERMSPAVLWIDEIEKAFAGAASHSSDGGLARRMFGALLTWMQERAAPVFLAATANDVSALPPELLRKGRFDEIFFVDLPDADARAAIASIHLERRNRDPRTFDLASIAAASQGRSGAEIEVAVEAALQRAFADGRREVSTRDVCDALASSPPLSVVMAEQISSLRRWASTRCVPAD